MKTKNLYLVSQSKNIDYDIYDSAVVCAKSAEDARDIVPGGITVRLIGVADKRTKLGIVLASFNV